MEARGRRPAARRMGRGWGLTRGGARGDKRGDNTSRGAAQVWDTQVNPGPPAVARLRGPWSPGPARPQPGPPRRPPVGRGLLGDHPHVGLLQCRPVPAQVRSHRPPVRPRSAAAASGLDPPPTAGSPAPTPEAPPRRPEAVRAGAVVSPASLRRRPLGGGSWRLTPWAGQRDLGYPSRLLRGALCILSSVVTVNARL